MPRDSEKVSQLSERLTPKNDKKQRGGRPAEGKPVSHTASPRKQNPTVSISRVGYIKSSLPYLSLFSSARPLRISSSGSSFTRLKKYLISSFVDTTGKKTKNDENLRRTTYFWLGKAVQVITHSLITDIHKAASRILLWSSTRYLRL
jgi:hypothetical protein